MACTRGREALFILLLAGGLGASIAPRAADWRPEKNVEIMVALSAGSAADRMARLMQRIAQERRYIESTSTVVNKPGGGGNIGWSYLNQFPGDAHYVGIATPALITNHILGLSPLGAADFTPLATLLTEHVAFAVRAESRITNGADLIARLQKDPASVSVAFAPALGNQFHIAAAALVKSSGGDLRRLRAVVYNGAGEAMAAVLGGHVDVMVTAASNIVPQMKAGRMRMIAVASHQRAPGPLAEVPTWKEQKADVTSLQWRAVVGPRNLAPAQIAFWDDVLERVTRAEEWQKDLDGNLAADAYLRSAEARRFVESQARELRAILAELGLAKR